jgi:hypothetical protein
VATPRCSLLAVAAPASVTDRALLWIVSGGQPEATTLLDVDRAHWAGKPDAARAAAQRLLDRNPGLVVQPRPADARSPLATARATMHSDVRLAVYRKYGLTVKLGP